MTIRLRTHYRISGTEFTLVVDERTFFDDAAGLRVAIQRW